MRRRPSECESVTRVPAFHPLQPPQTEAVEAEGAPPSTFGALFSLCCVSVKSLCFLQQRCFETLYTPIRFAFRFRKNNPTVKTYHDRVKSNKHKQYETYILLRYFLVEQEACKERKKNPYSNCFKKPESVREHLNICLFSF